MHVQDGALRMVAHRVGDGTMSSRSDSRADTGSESEEDAAEGFATLSMPSSLGDSSASGDQECKEHAHQEKVRAFTCLLDCL